MTTRKTPGAPARGYSTTPIADTNRSAYRSQDGYVMTAYERLLDALRSQGSTVNATGAGRAQAQCPAHDDTHPSLSVGPRRDSRGVVVHCHAGCAPAEVLAALGLSMRDLFDDDDMAAVYAPRRDYHYPDGRVVHRKPDKSFPQSGKTNGDSLFHADRVGDAETVYVVEGEKDVEAIELAGGAAVCPAMGAGKAHLADWTPLHGKAVIVVADKDEPGRKHAAKVAELLDGIAGTVRIVEASVGKDAADHLAADHTLDEFQPVVEADDDEPVDGAELLDEVHAALTKFVVFPSVAAAIATTLWITATHALPAWQHATRLAIMSPQKRCGKSRLLDIIAALSFNPILSTDMSTAVIFRKIGSNDYESPTLLIDEADAIFGTKIKAEQHEDLRGLLNAGFQRDRTVWRCVGPSQTPTQFNTFSMAALAAIKSLPDTIVDRAVVIDLKRRRSDETVSRFRLRRDIKPLHELRDRLTAWARDSDRMATFNDTEPEVPDSVEDRQQDAWEPLIAVADAAGGAWPASARKACLELCKQDNDDDLDKRLLSDINDVFTTAQPATFMLSQMLVNELKSIEDAPWSSLDKPLSVYSLAARLARYGVKPDRGSGPDQRRGYDIRWFSDAFERFL